MDRNTITGFVLIAGILLAMQYFNQPSEAEINRQEFLADSTRQVQLRIDSIAKAEGTATAKINAIDSLPDSLKVVALSNDFGAFAGAANGTAEEVTIENDLMTLTFSTKGGNIIDAQLKDYEKWSKDTAGEIIKEPLHILEDSKNKFEYIIPISGANPSLGPTILIPFICWLLLGLACRGADTIPNVLAPIVRAADLLMKVLLLSMF